MALKYATKSGAWSDPTVWNGGTLPGNGDAVYTNNFTVALDQDITIGGANNYDVAATALIVGCRYVIKTTGTTIWTGIGASSDAVGTKFLCSAVGAGSGVATTDACITNRSQSPAVAGGNITVPGSRTIEASLMANASTAFHAVTAGSITLVGNIFYASGTAVTFAAGTALYMTGDIMKSASSSTGGGVQATSAVVRITGDIYGSMYTTAGSSDTAGLGTYYTDVVVNGNVYGGGGSFYSPGISSALSPGAGLTINGNIYGDVGAGLKLGTSSISAVVNGNVFAAQSSKAGNGIYVADNAAANVTVVGNVYGGVSAGIQVGYASSTSRKIKVTGDVYGGDIYYSASYYGEGILSTYAVVEVIGNAYAGSVGPAIYTKARVTQFNGNEYDHANGTVAIVAYKRILGTYIGGVKRVALNGVDTFITLGDAFTDVAPSDVRAGLVYNYGTATGTCGIPPREAVAYGVPVDDTTGIATLTFDTFPSTETIAAAVRTELTPELTRLDNCATVDSTGAQLAAFASA